MYHKIGGYCLIIVGVFFMLVMLESSITRGEDWFFRTGYVGFIIGVTMLISGFYSIRDYKYNIVLRAVWSILWVVGATLPLFAIIGAAASGTTISFVMTVIVIVGLYAGLVLSTLIEILRKTKVGKRS